MEFNEETYRAAVEKLMKLAYMGCGGSSTAASVLLSLYNDHAYQVPLASVCCDLDSDYFRAVLICMQCRATLYLEPHSVIENGHERFDSLKKSYKSLRRAA